MPTGAPRTRERIACPQAHRSPRANRSPRSGRMPASGSQPANASPRARPAPASGPCARKIAFAGGLGRFEVVMRRATSAFQHSPHRRKALNWGDTMQAVRVHPRRLAQQPQTVKTCQRTPYLLRNPERPSKQEPIERNSPKCDRSRARDAERERAPPIESSRTRATKVRPRTIASGRTCRTTPDQARPLHKGARRQTQAGGASSCLRRPRFASSHEKPRPP